MSLWIMLWFILHSEFCFNYIYFMLNKVVLKIYINVNIIIVNKYYIIRKLYNCFLTAKNGKHKIEKIKIN